MWTTSSLSSNPSPSLSGMSELVPYTISLLSSSPSLSLSLILAIVPFATSRLSATPSPSVSLVSSRVLFLISRSLLSPSLSASLNLGKLGVAVSSDQLNVYPFSLERNAMNSLMVVGKISYLVLLSSLMLMYLGLAVWVSIQQAGIGTKNQPTITQVCCGTLKVVDRYKSGIVTLIPDCVNGEVALTVMLLR